MTQTEYRTTKIPVYYFSQIEEYLDRNNEFVSVSEFIRESIKEKLLRLHNEKWFLLVKDAVFNEEVMKEVHDKFVKAPLIKSVSLQKIVNMSLDADYLNFVSKFLVNFAYIHPFEDGNKRTSWTVVDVFLRLNNRKLQFNVEEDEETADEVFIWQNSAHQKDVKQVREFVKEHIVNYPASSKEVSEELQKSLKENKILLKKLAR